MSNAREIASVERAKAVALVREWDIVLKALGDAGPTGVKADAFSRPAKAARKPAKVTAAPVLKSKAKRSRLTRAKMHVASAKRYGKAPRPEALALLAEAEAATKPAEQAVE